MVKDRAGDKMIYPMALIVAGFTAGAVAKKSKIG
jgi:hypothetical protein